MPRPHKGFSKSDIETVRKLRIEGVDNPTISKAIGITNAALNHFLAKGAFGFDLPSRKGQSGVARKSRLPDDEKIGRIFNTTDWPQRQQEIRDGWDEATLQARSQGKMPNRTSNYSLFEKGHDPDKKKSRDRRQSPRSW